MRSRLTEATLVLLMGIIMGSCASHERDYIPPMPPGYLIIAVTSSVSLAYPGGTSDTKKALLKEAVEIQVRAFELEWGTKISPSVTVVVFESATIPCGDLPGTFHGCHYGSVPGHGPIHVIVGDRYHIPVLYHEFVHHMISDANHTDPRWGSWYPRQAVIAAEIWADRSGVVFD